MPILLFVDDDTSITSINKKYFTNLNYKVLIANNGLECLNILSKHQPDCILLDIMMPKMNGYDTLTKIKKISNAPIIFISGKTKESDRVKGLLHGADDYITKPYSLKELSARIQVQLRKNVSPSSGNKISYTALTIDLVDHKAFCNHTEIPLSNREFQLLHLLAKNPNEIVTFEDIGKFIWNVYTDSDRKNIMVTASRLRKKIDFFPELSNLIETVWSKGYKFIPK